MNKWIEKQDRRGNRKWLLSIKADPILFTYRIGRSTGNNPPKSVLYLTSVNISNINRFSDSIFVNIGTYKTLRNAKFGVFTWTEKIMNAFTYIFPNTVVSNIVASLNGKIT